VRRCQSKRGRVTKGMEDQFRTVAGSGRRSGMVGLPLRFRLNCYRFSCGHAGQNLPPGGCSEPGVGYAAGLGIAVTVLVFPGGGQPVVGHDDVAGRVTCCGSERIGPKVHALRGVSIDPVGYVVSTLRGRTDVRPADEVRMPQRSIADEIEYLHIVPVGLFELPDGGLVGRLLGKGNSGAKRQQQGDTYWSHLQDGRPLNLIEIAGSIA